jgi:hypothetical protein
MDNSPCDTLKTRPKCDRLWAHVASLYLKHGHVALIKINCTPSLEISENQSIGSASRSKQAPTRYDRDSTQKSKALSIFPGLPCLHRHTAHSSARFATPLLHTVLRTPPPILCPPTAPATPILRPPRATPLQGRALLCRSRIRNSHTHPSFLHPPVPPHRPPLPSPSASPPAPATSLLLATLSSSNSHCVPLPAKLSLPSS